MIERIEERVRNMVGPFHIMGSMLDDIGREESNKNRITMINYIIDNSKQISNTMENSINYLIDMSAIIDKYLPKDFDINELLDKTKYHC